MPLKVYCYDGCSTCKRALKFLDEREVRYEKIPIVKEPPTKPELRQMLSYIEANGGTFRNLFNTSGEQYREMKLSSKLKDGMTEAQALELLAKNGKLVKRPFVIGSDFGLLGFKEDLWNKRF